MGDSFTTISLRKLEIVMMADITVKTDGRGFGRGEGGGCLIETRDGSTADNSLTVNGSS